MTKELKCTCTSDFQDKTYGKGIRLHNGKTKTTSFECTVCGSVKR